MSTPSHKSETPVTAVQVDNWFYTINEKRFKLYPKLAGSQVPVEVCWEMADLLQEAIEEVRVISVSLRENSQALCGRAHGLRKHSTELLQRSARAAEQRFQFAPPPPEDVQQAESQMLAIFKHGKKQEEQS